VAHAQWYSGSQHCENARSKARHVTCNNTGTKMSSKHTAKSTMYRIASYVATNVLPAARGSTIAATLRQIGDIGDNLPLAPSDVCLAYMMLAQPSKGDDPRTQQRRLTCDAIAGVAANLEFVNWENPPRSRACERMRAVISAVAEMTAPSDDPRHVSMVETARREAIELA